MKFLPNNVSFYKKAPIFTNSILPKRLLNDHKTKENTLVVLCIVEGKLQYIIENNEVYTLDKNTKGVIGPQVRYHIKLIDDVLFFIEFYK